MSQLMEQLDKLRSVSMRSAQQLRKAGQDALAADLSYQLGIVTGLVMQKTTTPATFEPGARTGSVGQAEGVGDVERTQ